MPAIPRTGDALCAGHMTCAAPCGPQPCQKVRCLLYRGGNYRTKTKGVPRGHTSAVTGHRHPGCLAPPAIFHPRTLFCSVPLGPPIPNPNNVPQKEAQDYTSWQGWLEALCPAGDKIPFSCAEGYALS